MKIYSIAFIALTAISVGCAYMYAANKQTQNQQAVRRPATC